MAEPAPQYQEDEDVDVALAALGKGLTREVLASALLFSEAERRTCTRDDPGTLRGQIGSGRCTRFLREKLRPHGWRREEPAGVPLVVSPDLSKALIVWTGDEQTGNPTAPFGRTKWPHGPIIRKWLDPGHVQLKLFGLSSASESEPPTLWSLLVNRTSSAIIAEVSQATSVTPEGRIRFGGSRIFLKPHPIDVTVPIVVDDDDDPGESLVVPVERL